LGLVICLWMLSQEGRGISLEKTSRKSNSLQYFVNCWLCGPIGVPRLSKDRAVIYKGRRSIRNRTICEWEYYKYLTTKDVKKRLATEGKSPSEVRRDQFASDLYRTASAKLSLSNCGPFSLVHEDYGLHNFLFDENMRLTGILDWDYFHSAPVLSYCNWPAMTQIRWHYYDEYWPGHCTTACLLTKLAGQPCCRSNWRSTPASFVRVKVIRRDWIIAIHSLRAQPPCTPGQNSDIMYIFWHSVVMEQSIMHSNSNKLNYANWIPQALFTTQASSNPSVNLIHSS